VTRPGTLLAAIIAVAAATGVAVSLINRPPHATQAQVITPSDGATSLPRVPSVAFEFSVADDLATREVVLFGGVDDFNNTWLWTGSQWELDHPPVSPPGRYGAAAAFDPETDQILLFGGRLEPGTPVNDTWGWDGGTWQELNSGTGGPPPGDGAAMTWDPTRNQMLLVTRPEVSTGGGATWVWSGSTWRLEAAGGLGADDLGILVGYDPISKSVLAEGCCQAALGQFSAEQPSTWRWDGSRWRVVATSVSPTDGSSLATDSSRGQMVLCSCSLVGGVVPALWAWSGSQWVPMQTGAVPPQPQAEVDDQANGFLVLGFAIAAADSIAQPLQVWALEGTTWTERDTGASTG
jgi:hypothetical protein